MIVKYIDEDDPLELRAGKEYEVVEIDYESGWYRIVDETGEDYLFEPDCFEVITE